MSDLNPDSNSPAYIQAIQAEPGWVRILQSFARFVSPSAGERVVDVGCGPGALVEIFRHEYGALAIGIDPQFAMLRQTPRDNHAFVVGDAYHLPLATASVACITATNVLYLLDKPETVLREIVRVLQIGGRFAMLNPSPKMSVAAAHKLADARGIDQTGRTHLINWATIAEKHPRWPVKEIARMFEVAGLTDLQSQERIGDGLALYVYAIRNG